MKQRLLNLISEINNTYLRALVLVLLFIPILIAGLIDHVRAMDRVKLITICVLASIVFIVPIVTYNIYYYVTITKIVDGTPFFSNDDRVRSVTNYIVIHHDDVPSDQKTKVIDIYNFHRHVSFTDKVGDKEVKIEGRGWSTGFAYHYYMNDTCIFHVHNDDDFTVHAGNVGNAQGIAICLHGNYEVETPSTAMILKLIVLVRYLQGIYGIPSDHVIGHGEVPGNSTSCPGKNVNLATLRYFFKD